MLGVVLNTFSTTRDIAREFKKLHFEVVAMLQAKEAERNAAAKNTTAKLRNPTKAYTVQEVALKGACYGCGKLGHNKRDCRQKEKTRTEPSRANGHYGKQAPKNNYNGENVGNDDRKSYLSLMAKTEKR